VSGHFPIQSVGFKAGLNWLPASAEWMRRGFRALFGVAGLWLGISLVAIIPLVGQTVLALITPLLTAGVMLAFDQLGEGKQPAPGTLVAAWRDPFRRSKLLSLGIFAMLGGLVAAMVLVSWLSSQVGADALEAAVQSPEAMAQTMAGDSLGGGLLGSGLVMVIVLAGLFFAIPLVMFGRASTLTALATSLRAIARNWLAFVGFAIGAFAVAAGVLVMLLIISSVLTLALGNLGSLMVQVLMLIAMMLFQVLMAGAQYLAFCQIFGWSPGLEDTPDDEGEITP